MTIRVTFLCAPGGDATLDRLLGDVPLGELSLRRAVAARAALPPHQVAVRAPSIRCSQTADAFGLAAVVEPELRNLDLGTWCGRTVDEVAATDPHGFTAWLKDPDAAPHEGESVRRLCRRTADWLSSAAPDTGHGTRHGSHGGRHRSGRRPGRTHSCSGRTGESLLASRCTTPVHGLPHPPRLLLGRPAGLRHFPGCPAMGPLTTGNAGAHRR